MMEFSMELVEDDHFDYWTKFTIITPKLDCNIIIPVEHALQIYVLAIFEKSQLIEGGIKITNVSTTKVVDELFDFTIKIATINAELFVLTIMDLIDMLDLLIDTKESFQNLR
jgi:hypothetical protein